MKRRELFSASEFHTHVGLGIEMIQSCVARRPLRSCLMDCKLWSQIDQKKYVSSCVHFVKTKPHFTRDIP